MSKFGISSEPKVLAKGRARDAGNPPAFGGARQALFYRNDAAAKSRRLTRVPGAAGAPLEAPARRRSR